MNERKFTGLIIGLVVVFASIFMCVFYIFVMSNFGDSDKYDVTRDYTVDGTIVVDAVEYQCTGEGRSTPMKEGGDGHTYSFSFEIRYSDSSKKELLFVLFCDKSGNPAEDLYGKSTDPEGKTIWSYTEKGTIYQFSIEEYCKVPSVTISGDGLTLKAVLKE